MRFMLSLADSLQRRVCVQLDSVSRGENEESIQRLFNGSSRADVMQTHDRDDAAASHTRWGTKRDVLNSSNIFKVSTHFICV